MSGVLDGRRALVVGGGGGIGRAVATEFRRLGAAVAVADRPHTFAPGERGIDIDVVDPAAVRRAVSLAREAVDGELDVLVNAAGISTERYWDELELDEWRRVLDINLTGTFLVCKEVVPGMVHRGSGRIINIASQLAIKGGAGLAHYCASKAGVIGLTKSMALELAPRGVLVNAVAPGPVHTPMTDKMSDEWTLSRSVGLPLGRFGIPEEIAPTVALLASDPGGNLYVGQTLGPNSGDVMQ